MSTTPGDRTAPPPPPPERGAREARTSTLPRTTAGSVPPGPGAGGTGATGARPAGAAGAGGAGREVDPGLAGPRRVRLSISRIDPWSAMKLSFLLSVAVGIMIVVAAALVWFVLDSMHVFTDIEELLTDIGSADFLQLMDYLAFDRVMSLATVVAVVDILLMTALGTIGAFLYNIVAALVGGLHLTLTDD
ncbi:DUF3566 domain-containing protein [Georgenia sp. TF02-10]|uniref:DUF3566 domain-containing protein n=1 Tax=Georgenia sp. TF02-10 TaxID=2917725 RepID=UPI001FA8198E|nr:DUF3566 domain-containing protein [Georgenia sp. TF02-10]UNX54970.1 DUF3566 domain-containing protein [Georgenia sp. TF02-10]